MMIYVVEIEGRAIVTFPAETDIDAETFVEEEWFKDLMMKTHSGSHTRVKTQLTMLRFNGLVNRIGGQTDAGELVLV